MLKKCTFMVLFTVLAMAGMSVAAYNGTPTAKANFATETINNKTCYMIGTAEDLYGFAAIVNGTNGNTAEPTACGVLTQNITVNENVLNSAGELNTAPAGGFIEWTPIGTADNESADNWFSGTFDGQGHTISGLYFNDPDDGLYVGLFGYIGSAEETVSISNVGIEDSYFNAQSAVGGVVGYVYYFALNMENVYNAAVVVGAYYVGGVIGSVNLDGQTLSMVNVYNVGSINGTDESVGSTGGLVGDFMNDSEESKITIKNSYNYGTVVGGNPLVGVVENSDYEDAVTVTNSFYLGSSSSGAYGEFKSAADFSNGTVYAALHSAEGGDVWFLSPGDKYPTLSQEKNGPAVNVVTLNYPREGSSSEYDSETISYVEGFAKSLPTMDKNGNPILGWYTSGNGSSPITEISASTSGAMTLFPKMYEPVNGCYEIADANQLYLFAAVVNNGNATVCGKLTANITVNQNVLGENNAKVDATTGDYIGSTTGLREWTPINNFNGMFDGRGYFISGLYYDDKENGVGLFGCTLENGKNASIKNVGVEDSYFRGKNNVGGILGLIEEEAEVNIENVYSAAVVVGNNSVGGIVGSDMGLKSNVNNAYNVGLVFGVCRGEDEEYCGAGIGGIVGYNYSDEKTTVHNSFNYGTVSANFGTAGALVGAADDFSVTNSFYLGSSSSGKYGTVMTSDEFANGTVLAALQANADGYMWVQGDKYPVLGSYEPVNGCYEIANAGQLYWFAAIVNNGNTNACGKLTANIVVNENVLGENNANVNATTGEYIGTTTGLREWTPIGNNSNPFTGSFDGQGHTISGLYFKDIKAEEAGLFGDVNGTVTIDNVGLVDSYIMAGSYAGGLVGYAQGSLTISNSYNASSVNAPGHTFGGLVGAASDDGSSLAISNSYNVGPLNGGGFGGGLVGFANKLVVTNSYNAGSIYNRDEYAALVGGITSSVTGATTITNCFNYGSINYPSDISVTVDDLVAKVDNNVKVTVTNSFTIGESKFEGGGSTKVTSDEFSDGKVLAALNPAEGDAVWEQGKDYPILLVFSNSDDEFKPNAEGYYEIASADDLYKFAEIVNNGTVPDAKAKLMNDIVVNQNVLGTDNANVDADGNYIGADSASFRKWTPIGNNSKPFKGSFDGQGYTISGLYSNSTSGTAGLFGFVDGYAKTPANVSIQNVGVEDSYFKAETVDGNATYAGGILADVGEHASVNLENVYSSAVAVAPYAGGIIGEFYGIDLSVTNAFNVGDVVGTTYGGGLVGYVDASGSVDITNGYNYETSMNGNGALLGSVRNGTNTPTVTNSFYLASEKVGDYGSYMSADEFADGTVLIALRSGDDGSVWVQNPNDKYPSIDINATNANTIVLDWSTAADSTTLVGAGYTVGAVVIVKAGKTFYADGKIYEGVLSAEQVATIGQNKLYPISGVKLENVGDKLVATLNGDSNKPLMIPTDIAVDKVVYKRNILNSTYATIMLPFSVSLTNLSGFTFYKFASMAENKNGYRYVAQVSWVKEMLEANTPYIMVPKNSVSEIQFEAGASAKFTLNTTTGSRKVSTKDGAWEMTGVYEYKVWEEGNTELGRAYGYTAASADGYKIGQFAKLGAGASIQPMRMYLIKTSKSAPLGRPGLSGAFAQTNDLPETIGIEIVDNEEQTMLVNRISVVPTVVKSNRWFDMKGRALGGKPTTKGTYYYNGKRVIIK